jgi:hypothetical protein
MPGSGPSTESCCKRFRYHLAEGKENARAQHVYIVCLALHPKSARALAGIAGLFAKTGQTTSAANFYADAIRALPQDPSLDATQRQQLAVAWESARKTLAGKQDSMAKL